MNFNDRFVVLDIETTGITYEYFDEPTEIALIEIINGKLTGNNKHFYLKPRKSVSKSFLKKVFGKNLMKKLNFKDFSAVENFVQKIDKDTVLESEKDNLDEIIKEFKKVIEMSDKMYDNISNGQSKYNILPIVREFIGDSIVIAHNAVFDVNFLNYWFNYLKLPLIQNYICTLTNFKNHFGFKENNLTACCNYYGISLDGAHNALEDTTACANLFIKEISEFPEEIIVNKLEKHIAYSNFKKRVMNTNYCQFAKAILSESCNMPINIESLEEAEIDSCKHYFFKFKKPLEVANFTGLDLGSVEAIFIDWVNCININKHQDLLKDKYLLETIKEILLYTDNNMDKIKDCCNIIFNNEPNYFYFKLVNKLENCKDIMSYDLNDFDYYFINLRDLNSLALKIERDESYIYQFLLKWIGTDNSKFLKYKEFFKNNYNKKSGEKLYKEIEKSENKQYIFRQLGIK